MSAISQTANALIQKINYENETGAEIPLSEFLELPLDTDESFEEGITSVTEEPLENLELESVMSAVVAGVRKLVEVFLVFFETTGEIVTKLLRNFDVIKIRIGLLKNKLKDAKKIGEFKPFTVKGNSLLGDKDIPSVVRKLKTVTADFQEYNSSWPRERAIVYANLKDILNKGRDIKNVNNVIETIRAAAEKSTLGKEDSEKYSISSKDSTEYNVTSSRDITELVHQLEILCEQVKKFASVLSGSIHDGFVLKSALNSFTRNYDDLSKDTDINNTLRSALRTFLVVNQDDWKLLNKVGRTYLKEGLILASAAYTEAVKASQ